MFHATPVKDNISSELYSDADRKALCLMISLGRFYEMFGKRDIYGRVGKLNAHSLFEAFTEALKNYRENK